jgi:orotate phosphoribosyltransferase
MTPAERNRLHELIDTVAISRGQFTLASGKSASYYVDLRKVSLSPEGAYLSALALLDALKDDSFEAIGGPASAAFPLTGAIAAVSWQIGRPAPGFMVRKEPKGHGLGNLIEGPLAPGARVAIIDDTATTGGSIVQAIDALEACGCPIAAVAVIVDREEGAGERFAQRGLPFRRVFSIREFDIGS